MGALTTPEFTGSEQISVALAGGGANATATIGVTGGYREVVIVSTVAAFVGINSATATNSASATGLPIAANVPLILHGPITRLAFNGATAGTVVIWGVR